MITLTAAACLRARCSMLSLATACDRREPATAPTAPARPTDDGRRPISDQREQRGVGWTWRRPAVPRFRRRRIDAVARCAPISPDREGSPLMEGAIRMSNLL